MLEYLIQIYQITESLKHLDACQILKNIMFAQQKYFDYKDRPGTALTKVLEESTLIKKYFGIKIVYRRSTGVSDGAKVKDF